MPVSNAAPPISNDWTYPVCQAVHALVDMVVNKPLTTPGPWVISFTRDGAAHINYRAATAPAGAVLISEPGWYRFIWGPCLAKLARHLWETVAGDLETVGVKVTLPSEAQYKELYWGPMPAEAEPLPGQGCRPRSSWCMPGMAQRAVLARAEFEAQLKSAHPVGDPLPFSVRPRRPHKEELDARFDARKPAPEPEPRKLPSAWSFGHWGKGFMSASGRRYVWQTSSPASGGHPQHKEAQALIAAGEGAPVLEQGRELTGAELGYVCPIVIAPDGSYTHDSADPFWRDPQSRPEFTGRQRARFDPAGFAGREAKALRYVADREKWSDAALGHGHAYGHVAGLLRPPS